MLVKLGGPALSMSKAAKFEPGYGILLSLSTLNDEAPVRGRWLEESGGKLGQET